MASWWQNLKAKMSRTFGPKGREEKWSHLKQRYGMDYTTQGGTFNRLTRQYDTIKRMSDQVRSARRRRNLAGLVMLGTTAQRMLEVLNNEYNTDPVITRSNEMAQKANANLYALAAVVSLAEKGIAKLRGKEEYEKGTTVGPTAEQLAEEDIESFRRSYWPKRRKFKKAAPPLVAKFRRIM